MDLPRNPEPFARPAVDLDETRRRFLLAREQTAAHAPADRLHSVREARRSASALTAPRRARG